MALPPRVHITLRLIVAVIGLVLSLSLLPLMVWLYLWYMQMNVFHSFTVVPCFVKEVNEKLQARSEYRSYDIKLSTESGETSSLSDFSNDTCGSRLWQAGKHLSCYRSTENHQLFPDSRNPLEVRSVVVMAVCLFPLIVWGACLGFRDRVARIRGRGVQAVAKPIKLRLARFAFTAVLLAIVVILFWQFITEDLANTFTRGWTSAQCTVVAICPKRDSKDSRILYEDEHKGVIFVSTVYAFGQSSKMAALPADLKPGLKIPCFHNPEAPFQMKLAQYREPTAQRYILTLALVGLGFMLMRMELRRVEAKLWAKKSREV